MDKETDVGQEGREEELERLRKENEELRRQVESKSEESIERTYRTRNGFAAAIAVAAALVLALAIPAVWLNRMLTDTETYVQTVAPLARDAAIQDVVALATSDAIITRLDTKTRVQQVLPQNLQPLAVPIASAVNGFITTETDKLVRSDQFGRLWDEVNRRGHKALVAALTGRQGIVGVQAGTITLNVGALIDAVVARLKTMGLGFVENLPVTGIDKTVTLYQSPALAQATQYVAMVSSIAYWLPIIGLALVAGAFALAVDRRKAALWLGFGLLVWTLLPLQSLYLGQTYAAGRVQELAGIPTQAAQNGFTIIFRDLVTAEQTAIALALILILGAVIAGPAKWAVALRGAFTGGISGAGAHLDLGPVGPWVAPRKALLRAVGFITAAVILALIPPPRTIAEIVWLAVGVVVWVLLVELAGAAVPAKE